MCAQWDSTGLSDQRDRYSGRDVGGEGQHIRRVLPGPVSVIQIGTLGLSDHPDGQFGIFLTVAEGSPRPGDQLLLRGHRLSRVRHLHVDGDCHDPLPSSPLISGSS